MICQGETLHTRVHATNSCKNKNHIDRCHARACRAARRRYRTCFRRHGHRSGRRYLSALCSPAIAILHVRALQNIDPVMPAVGFNFLEFEARVSVEHRADHFVENFEEKRSDKRQLRRSMQTLSARLHTDPDGFFDQADGLFL